MNDGRDPIALCSGVPIKRTMLLQTRGFMIIEPGEVMEYNAHGPLLLTWIIFISSMDK